VKLSLERGNAMCRTFYMKDPRFLFESTADLNIVSIIASDDILRRGWPSTTREIRGF